MALRIFVSVDMEGVSGVVHPQQTSAGGQDYDIARRLMTLEANAAVEGAMEAGADDVVVNDSHGSQRNLLPELLDPRARLITGSPKPLTMMAGLDPTYEAAICIGYHARAGTQGIMDHTIMGSVVYDVRVNGEPQGELGLNAGIAGYFGVPIVLVSGDSNATAQAAARIPGVEVAAVKVPLSRYAARSLSPSNAQALIRDRAKRAVERRGAISPVRYPAPVHVSLQFMNSAMAEVSTLVPGVRQTSALTVEYTLDDFLEVFNCLRALIYLGASTISR
jgi:D-amino peptidase